MTFKAEIDKAGSCGPATVMTLQRFVNGLAMPDTKNNEITYSRS